MELSSKIKVLQLPAGSSYSNPLGHPLGALLAPNWLPRWPQEPPRRPQDGSKTHQDASKQAPGALQDPSNNAKELSRTAKRRPRAPRDPPGLDFDHSRGRLGVALDTPGGPDQGSYSLGRRDSRTRIQFEKGFQALLESTRCPFASRPVCTSMGMQRFTD